MKLIKPGYVILSDINSEKILKDIEYAGRTCYKSEEKITEESAKKFIKMLIKRGHESVLEHEKITVKIICDRGISHELVRHRICSFSQESTRYCNYSKNKFGGEITFIIPHFWNKDEPCIEGTIYNKYLIWKKAMMESEKHYLALITHEATPQQARSVLPNSLKTEIVVTANLREWRLIFTQRTSNAAHPQMTEIMRPLLDELKTKLPVIFDDINYD